jgi:hypothetical protein
MLASWDQIEMHEANPFLISMCTETSGKQERLCLVVVQGESLAWKYIALNDNWRSSSRLQYKIPIISEEYHQP